MEPNMKALGLAAALIGAVCSGLPAHANEPVTYLLPAQPNQPAFAPWLIARQQGYYADAGYDVAFAAAQGGIDVAQQVAIGKVAVGGAIGDTPIIARNYGMRVKVLATLGGGSLTVIVANHDRGIHTVQDLRGKRVVVMSRTDSTYHVLLGVLAAAGLARDDVTIDTARTGRVVRGVISGTQDACACVPDWEVEILRAQPDAVVIPTGNIFPSMAQAIIATDKTIGSRPAMLKAIVSATLRGMRFIMDDPRRAADVYSQAVPRYKGQEEMVARLFQAYIDNVYQGQSVIGETDPGRLTALQDFYQQQHFIRAAVPVDELYTNEFVPGVTE